MRGESFYHQGILSFNACCDSIPEARIAIPGETLELGHWAEPFCRDVGSYAAGSGIDVLVGIRGAASHMLDAAQRAGLRSGAALFFISRSLHIELAVEQPLAQDSDTYDEGRR